METNKALKEREVREALELLRSWVKPGDTIYTIVRHVSSSGMMRVIDLKVVDKESGRILHIGYNVAKVLGYTWDKREGLRVGGCGMDMGFHVVYSLGRVLFSEGFKCPGKTCPHNSHYN